MTMGFLCPQHTGTSSLGTGAAGMESSRAGGLEERRGGDIKDSLPNALAEKKKKIVSIK